jgi:putative salt-induced outer membrane protein YdiY
MKHKLSVTLALGILTIAIAAATARAQTVANGPYYAPPSWDQTLPVATRFIILSNFGSNAVLDRETGLVWERSPANTPQTWNSARFQCTDRVVGGRIGWRLPSVHELYIIA